MTETTITFSLIFLWSVVLLALHILLTVTRRINAIYAIFEQRPELQINAPAPDFEAETLMGEKVTLNTYNGRAVAFIFVDPHCGPCRKEIPTLEVLGPLAKKNFDINIIIVSESSDADARRLIKDFKMELPVIIAPRKKSSFGKDYNPRGINPYYCYIDKQGNVRARDPLGKGEWPKLQRMWASVDTLQNSAKSFNRYT
jgi:peroxiredoxin